MRSVTHQRALDAALSRPPDSGEGVLEIAALLEGRTHVSGIGWRLATAAGLRPVRTATRRRGRTLLFSELTALRAGLTDAAAAGCRRVRVRAPGPVLPTLFREANRSPYRRAALTAGRMRPLIESFEAVEFESTYLPDAELAHAVGEALDVGLHRAAEEEEHRAHVMERIVERAKEVRLESHDGAWIANGRYRVSLDPMRCECPAWAARWARVPIAGRRATRLPCKHLVALALREGLSVPADLAQLARRAPP